MYKKTSALLLLSSLLIISSCSSINPPSSSSPLSSTSCGEVSSSNVSSESIISSSELPSSSSISSKSSRSYDWPTERSNPCITHAETPDPCIIRSDEDGYFYIFGTQGRQKYDGEMMETAYIPIFRSIDMVEFEYVGSMLEESPKWNKYQSGVWAPDVIKYKGLYYCYYTSGVWDSTLLMHNGIGIATTDRLDGEWTDHGKLICGTDTRIGDYWEGSCMDACVVEYNARLYLFFGSFAGIYYVPLSEDGFSIEEGARATLVIGGAKEGERNGDYEGSFVRYMNGHWYIMGSHGSCCSGGEKASYTVVSLVSTTDTPFGPYAYYNSNGTLVPGLKTIGDSLDHLGSPVLMSYDKGWYGEMIGNVAGPGHNALFQDDAGDWYILYHGYVRPPYDGYATGRILFYDKLKWDDSYEYPMPYVDGVTKYASSFDYGKSKIDPPYLR